MYLCLLTFKAGIQTVNGYKIIYHPAQNRATKNEMNHKTMSQTRNHKGLPILKKRKNNLKKKIYCKQNNQIRKIFNKLRTMRKNYVIKQIFLIKKTKKKIAKK